MQQHNHAKSTTHGRFWLRWLVTLLALGVSLVFSAGAISAPTAAPWPPFVRIVPQGNGDDVTVYAEGIGHAYSHLHATFGGTSHTWSHANLDYDVQDDLYRGMAPAALSEPCPDPVGCLRIATGGPGNPNLETLLTYEFVAAGPIATPDLALERAHLRFGAPPFTDAVTHTVILAIPPTAPSPLPAGWWPLENSLYVVESDAPDGSLRAVLTVRYDPDWLDSRGVRAEDLRLWCWNAADPTWVMLPSTVNAVSYDVSASTDALTAYILAAPWKNRLWLPLVMR